MSAFTHLSLPTIVVDDLAPTPDWMEYLGNVREAEWRPAEWVPEYWLFVGDPDNAATRIFRCTTPNCEYLTDIRKAGRCVSCMKLLRENGGDAEQLERLVAIRPRHSQIRNGQPKRACRVERDGRQCERASHTNGVCDTHDVHWRTTYRPSGMTLDEFVDSDIPNPLSAIGPCIVPACIRERRNKQTELCDTHQEQFKKRSDKDIQEGDFAARTEPIRVRGNFSLLPLPEPLRSELLVVLQAEDRAGYGVNPVLVYLLTQQLAHSGNSFAEPGFLERAQSRAHKLHQTNQIAFLRRAATTIKFLESRFNNVDPTDGDLWDTFLIGLQTTGHRLRRRNPGNEGKFTGKRAIIDFTPIRQTWLRELVKQWGRDMRPTTTEIAKAVKAFSVLSQAISLRPGGEDPSTAGLRDIQKMLELINELRKQNGEIYGSGQRSKYLTVIRRALHYLRGAGFMNSIPMGFAVTPDHRVARTRPSDDEPGRALPYRVITALSRAVPSLPDNRGQTGAAISGSDLGTMHRAALRALIDTGRRPNEVCSLRIGCVTKSVPFGADGNVVEYTLTYDNHKAGRDGRTLPITRETGEALLEWERIRQTFKLSARYDKWLFPSPSAGRRDADNHLTTGGLNRALTRLVQLVPRLEDDVPDRESGGYLAFMGKIEPYSFRHSYAQRHADAGVDPDTLRELMDHRSVTTTMGYYTVSAKRKRAAIEKLSPMSVDWHGVSAPMVSTSSYEVGSVAVPWGNCTDPSNVKAGGHACPIRFRCSGCSMYRPDPSFLPGMHEHVTQLRASLSMVEIAGSAAPWVLQSMREEIAGYDEIMQAMRTQIAALPAEERDAVDDASAALRKVRAQRPMIPLTVVRRTDA